MIPEAAGPYTARHRHGVVNVCSRPFLRAPCRADALDRFAVLQVQWQQLVAQLRPLAKHYVANPKVRRC